MACLSRYRRLVGTPLLFSLVAVVGCGRGMPALPSYAGTTSYVQFTESNPPFLTEALARRIRPGMPQEEVLVILRDAAQNTPSAKSSIETAYTTGKLNPSRYDLTIAEGKRKLVLAFKAEKLAEMKQEGLD